MPKKCKTTKEAMWAGPYNRRRYKKPVSHETVGFDVYIGGTFSRSFVGPLAERHMKLHLLRNVEGHYRVIERVKFSDGTTGVVFVQEGWK